MVPINRSALTPAEKDALENATAGVAVNSINAEDLMSALVELGDIIAAQDDALVELAELIEEE
mgnify:CR=1 FL=1